MSIRISWPRFSALRKHSRPENSGSAQARTAPPPDARAQTPITGFLRERMWPLIALAVTVLLSVTGGLAFLERELSDLNFRLISRPASGSLVFVAIDPPSLRALDTWPWPRHYHAELLEQLVDAGAKRIAFDVDFSSRSSATEDARFAKALAEAPVPVILAAFKQLIPSPEGSKLRFTTPLADFRAHARLGLINVVPDGDGRIRRMLLKDSWNGVEIRSLVSELVGEDAIAKGSPHVDFGIDFGIDLASIPRLSYVDVLEGRFDPGQLRGKTVLVGAAAIELGDTLAVPVLRSLPGASLIALSYESVVQGRSLQPLGSLPVLAIAFLLAFVLGPRFNGLPIRWALGLTLGIPLIAVAGGVGVYAFAPLIVDSTPIVLLMPLLFGAGLVRRVDQQALRLLLQGISLQRTNALMRAIVENSLDGIVTIDHAGTIVTVNRAAANVFGYAPEELVGTRLSEILPDLLKGEGPTIELSAQKREVDGRRRDGTPVPVEIAVSEARGEAGGVFILIVRDVTDRKAHEAQLRYMALYDPLTGLPNRSLLQDRLGHAVRTAQRNSRRLVLFLIDLDRFKEVNDTLGHPIGDLLLEQVARRLAAPLRRSDTIARLGGDEFAILLPNISDTGFVEGVARRCLEALEEPFEIEHLSLAVSASIGIALFPDHAEEPSRLLQCADVAMYIAKKSGTRIAWYDVEKDHNSVRHLVLAGELRQAIEGDQLALYYQPKIDIPQRRVCGAEGLVRWFHPRDGFVPADEFIALAESTGLIRPLTLWVLEAGFRQLAAWTEAGREFGLSLNLSARNLQESDLADSVSRLIEQTGVEAGRVTFEITESAIMVDPAHALSIIRDLSALGVHFSIDDFGTGYSSLSYLKRLPVAELKIDKSFVIQMTEDHNDAEIVRATIDLGHNLGLKVVGEGVEGVEHFAVLKGFGCDMGQGYYFSPPLPIDEFDSWLESNRWARGMPGPSLNLVQP